MGPTLSGNGVMGVFNCCKRPPVNHASQVTQRDLEGTGTAETAIGNSRCLQPSGRVSCGRRWHFLNLLNT
jgi:hypothetical protein